MKKAFFKLTKGSAGFTAEIVDEAGKVLHTTEPCRSEFSANCEVQFFRRQNGYGPIRQVK